VDRAHIWPEFRDEWVVHRDDAVIVVDKPAGVASQAADEERPDDIVTRLRSHLGGRYLGQHQRLDKDTSGLMVFALDRAANARLAAQFEGRGVGKTYVAGVIGWPRARERATLRDTLGPAGKRAVTHVRVLARRGDRALLELVLETGRMHQARVQLARAGAPIAGDTLYGKTGAARLMLHASGLALEHPTRGGSVAYSSPPPAELTRWLERGDLGAAVYDDPGALAAAIALAVERRWGLGRCVEGARATTAFRLVNEEGDALPGLAVDVYDAWLVAQFQADGASPRDRVLDALAGLGFDGVYVKVRPKQANILVDTRREDLAPRAPLRGRAAPDELGVLEEGMPLLVRLGDGLSTGLFLDQRGNRRRVRAMAGGLQVANLFAYTCAFTVAAALGGAERTVSVDASAAALERGRRNLVHAGVADDARHAMVAGDAFAWLARAARRGERFGLVLLDPPSYSSTKRARFVADHDYARLAADALAILAPGGRLLACTNHRGISKSRFRRILFDAARLAKRDATQVKDLPEPLDFPAPVGGEAHAKSVLVTLQV
jgi:23S rRNA (cytosine1962-C5)-methyltransferase